MNHSIRVDKDDKKRLFSNFASLSVMQTLSFILPLLTMPYLVRILGLEKYGLVIFGQAFAVFFNILVDFGFNLSATREVSIYREDEEILTQIFSSVMTLKFLLIIASFLLLFPIIFAFEKLSNDWQLYYLSFLAVIGKAMFPVWYFQGIEKMKYITIVNAASKLVFTAAILVFIRHESDYLLVPLLNSFGLLFGGIYSLWIIKEKFLQKFEIQKSTTLLKYFKDSSQFFLSRISSVGYSNLNVFMAGVLLNPVSVGYYYIADRVVNVSLSLFDPLIQTIYPYLSQKFNYRFLRKLVSYSISVSLLIAMGLYFSSDLVSLILIGEQSFVFQNLLSSMLPIIPISILYVMLGAPLLLARGYKKEFNLSITYGFILHLIVLGLLYLYYSSSFAQGEYILLYFSASLVFSKLLVLFLRVYYIYSNKIYQTL